MKCDNCERDAIYKVDPRVANVVYYCNLHLPEFMRSTANTGAYDIEVPVAPVSKKKSASTTPTE